MTQPTPSKRPRRKQAVPVKYQLSDDSSDDFPNLNLSIPTPPCRKQAPKDYQQLEKGTTKIETQDARRLLLKFKIKNSSSSEAYVERAEPEEPHPREGGTNDGGRRKRKCTLVKQMAAAAAAPERTSKVKQTSTHIPRSYKRYQTFPKCFKTQVVKHALANSADQAAREFKVSVHKVRHWMRNGPTRQGHGDPRDSPPPRSPFPASFKLFAIGLAEEKSTKEAAQLLSLDEAVVERWRDFKEGVDKKATSDNVPQWETDVFVGVRRDMLAGHEIRVSDLLGRAESLKVDQTDIDLQWASRWCERFKLICKDHLSHPSRELSEVTLLQLPMDMMGMTPTLQVITKPTASGFKLSRKKLRGVSATEMDLEIWRWYKKMERKGKKLTKALVCARAQHIFVKHGHPESRAGEGWYRAWKTRCALQQFQVAVADPDTEPEEESFSADCQQQLPREKTSSDSQNKPTAQQREDNEIITPDLRPVPVEGDATDPDLQHPCATQEMPAMCSVVTTSNDNNTSSGPSSYSTCYSQPAFVEPLVLLSDCDTGSSTQEFKLGHLGCQQQHLSFAPYWIDQSHGNSECAPKAEPGHAITPFHETFLGYNGAMGSAADASTSSLAYSEYGMPIGTSTCPSSQKKKNERYLPEFKLQVVKYALQTTFKKTAEHFGVHHSTVAEWCRDKEKLERRFPQEKGSLVRPGEATGASPPEQAFLSWLYDCNSSCRKIDAAQVKEKVKEILAYFGENKVETMCRWLYVWHKKRLEMEQMIEDRPELQSSSGKEFRIAFPPAVKLEIVKVAERQKLSDTAKCFQIDRNSLSDWSKAQAKLKLMIKEGKVRRKEVSKSKKALEAEMEVFQWYQQCRANGYKPGPKEVRTRAAEAYRKHGDTTMKCSIGWYSRWSRRFGIQLRYEKDDEILEWVLTQLEQNRSITHHDIQVRAVAALSQTRTGFKCSAGWPIRFCKRHQALLQKQPTLEVPLPAALEDRVSLFRQQVQRLQEQHSLTNAAIGAMDEVPLYFSVGTSGGIGGGTLLVRRCSLEASQAVVLLSCLSDGAILPPLVILKASSHALEANHSFVLQQEDMHVDRATVEHWVEVVWRRFVPSPSLLFLDCFEPHTVVASSVVDVKVAVTPSGCSSQTHPVVVWLRRKFQALVHRLWLEGSAGKNVPTTREIVDCVARTWKHLQAEGQDAVRKSFMVTGAVLAPDHSDDHLLGRAELLPDVEEEDIYF
ncbi:uncharacterized protein ISCGN_003579 [Ixodes scapularis]